MRVLLTKLTSTFILNNINHTKFTCGECGSSQVEVKKWVDLNTDEVGDCVGEHQHDYWCNFCQENLSNDNLIELKDDNQSN